MLIKPTSDFVFLKVHKEEGATDGGILIPVEAETETVIATVTHAGPGHETPEGTLIEVPCKVGDKVIYNESGFVNKVNIFGDEYLVVRGLEIIAIVEGIEDRVDERMTVEDAIEAVRVALVDTLGGWGWHEHPEEEFAYYATHEAGRVAVRFMRSHQSVQFMGVDTGSEDHMSFEELQEAILTNKLDDELNDIMDEVIDYKG
jgi:chaperonin GroES